MNCLFYALNMVRSVPVWLIVKSLDLSDIIEQDMYGYRYAVDSEHRLKGLLLFNRVTASRKMFRNVIVFRIKKKSKKLAYVAGLILPQKADLELCQGEIAGGLTIYHGHATVVVCEKAGKNLTLYQGVTIGKNSKEGESKVMPTIGNDVTVYTNAVVAGGIKIGNNVDIGAGAVVMKDVPDNTMVIGNPCYFKTKDYGKENGR